MTHAAARLAQETADAYMADSYGETEWESCCQELLNRGATPEQAETILRSKVMRWADDGAVNPNPTADGFRHYLGNDTLASKGPAALARWIESK